MFPGAVNPTSVYTASAFVFQTTTRISQTARMSIHRARKRTSSKTCRGQRAEREALECLGLERLCLKTVL